MSSLYVHIPFCKAICAYCDFPKVLFREEWALSYLSALFQELAQFKEPYETIYIGGGTPTSLTDEELASLLNHLSSCSKGDTEWSIETNPELLSKNTLSILKKYGVNRISIGMESSNHRLLKLMNRLHDFNDVKNAVIRAKEAGFKNLNVDFIYGLPLESEEELKRDIDAVLSLEVPHISAYSLSVSPGTSFYSKHISEANDEIAAKQYNLILSSLRKRGYSRYEVSNFALPGYECKHNLTYWKDNHYDAIGLGASGYRDDIRYCNTKNLSKYLRGEFRESEEKVTQKDDIEYYFLTNLRLQEGFSLLDFKTRFGFSFLSAYKKEFSHLLANNLLIEEAGRVKPTDQGILLLDRILLELFP